MPSSFDTSGLDDLQRRLEALQNTTEVSLAEVFPDGFMREHTQFESLSALQHQAETEGFSFETPEALESLLGTKWDSFISRHTDFSDWQEMLNQGGAEYAARRLGLQP